MGEEGRGLSGSPSKWATHLADAALDFSKVRRGEAGGRAAAKEAAKEGGGRAREGEEGGAALDFITRRLTLTLTLIPTLTLARRRRDLPSPHP